MAQKDKEKSNDKASGAEDLIGDTGRRAKNVLSGKSSAAGNAKGAGGGRGQGRSGQAATLTSRAPRGKAQKTIGERGADKRAAAERSARGEGKYYFPPDDPERAKIRKLIERGVKQEVTTKEFAEKHDLSTWKVRLVAKQMSREKGAGLKIGRSGENGGMITMSPQTGKSRQAKPAGE